MANTMAACKKGCPGCGMTFSPDPDICPPEAFRGYRLEVEGFNQKMVELRQSYKKTADNAI